MNCLYCGHELNLERWEESNTFYVSKVPTRELSVICRSCGATYHIEQQVSGLPKLSEEMIEKIRKQKRYGGSEATAT